MIIKNSTWNGIDISWAYCQLLPAIQRQILCSQKSADILHDALIRFVVSLSPDRHEKPHAYLRVIVQHLIADEYRASGRYISVDIEALDHFNHSITPTLSPSTEYLVDIKQRLHYAEMIIKKLPKRCREVFWLQRVEGYTQTEIAAKLGMSKNMVERHMMRAIVDLSTAKEWIMAE